MSRGQILTFIALGQQLVYCAGIRSAVVFWGTGMTLTNGATLMNWLSEIDDPRKLNNGRLHDFLEMLVIAVAAVLSDCDTMD